MTSQTDCSLDTTRLQCLCGAQTFTVLLEGNYSFFTTNGQPAHFQAVQCNQCHLVMTNPPPTEAAAVLQTLEHDRHKLQQDDDFLLASSRVRAQRLAPYLTSTSQVLEIGCSTGRLVQMIQELGVAASIGIELSQAAVQFGRNLGRDIRDTLLQDCAFPDNHFDVIQAHHVLEHIPNLPQVLEEAYRILKPQGLFYVTVPRYDSPFNRSANWSGWFPQEHFWHFTPTTLNQYMTQQGFHLKRFSCPLQTEFSSKADLFYPLRKFIKFSIQHTHLGDVVEAFFIKPA